MMNRKQVSIGWIGRTLEEKPLNVAVVDLETNGLDTEDSVLSISLIAERIETPPLRIVETKRINRYYYPVERFRASAIAYNGLSEREISNRRRYASYPRHFREDREMAEILSEFDCLISHNASFDIGFLGDFYSGNYFCTMRSNIRRVRRQRRVGSFKYPSLTETAQKYEIPWNRKKLHESEYDADLTRLVFEKMLQTELSKMGIELAR